MFDDELEKPDALINPVPSGEELISMFLNEHSFESGWMGEDFVIGFEGPEIPPLDPNCLFCDTPLKEMKDVGWKHLAHVKDRAYCQFPWPGEGLEFMQVND